jgi:hypothetical protein
LSLELGAVSLKFLMKESPRRNTFSNITRMNLVDLKE